MSVVLFSKQCHSHVAFQNSVLFSSRWMSLTHFGQSLHLLYNVVISLCTSCHFKPMSDLTGSLMCAALSMQHMNVCSKVLCFKNSEA